MWFTRRLYFGVAKGSWAWGVIKGLCGCIIVDAGPFYLTLCSKTCKCSICNKFTCICGEE